MVFNRFIWDNYCQTLRGQAKVKEFSRGAEATDMELVEQVRAFNKNVFGVFTPEAFIDALGYFQFAYGKMLEDATVENIDRACELYAGIADTEVRDEKGKIVAPAGD